MFEGHSEAGRFFTCILASGISSREEKSSDSVRTCRRAFEPFGGLKSAVIGARDGAPANKEIVISSSVYSKDADAEEAPPVESTNNETAYLADLHLTYIAFDILYSQNEVQAPMLSSMQLQPTLAHSNAALPNFALRLMILQSAVLVCAGALAISWRMSPPVKEPVKVKCMLYFIA